MFIQICSIRGGMNSIIQIGPPLVVLDGMEIGLLGNAENMVDVHSVKTIEVLKSAPEWGARGANGIILINTK